MSLLDSLSRGLRGAAGVLSPDIQKQTMQQDQQNAILGQQQKMAILQHVQQQVQSGALPPEAGQAIAAKIGAPPELVGNVGVDAQAKMEALKNERGFREAAAAAGGDMTKISEAAMRFGKPEIASTLYKAQEDRLARLQTAQDTQELKRATLQQAHELTLSRLSGEQERRAETARHNRAMEGLQAQNAAMGNMFKSTMLELQKQKLDLMTDEKGKKEVQQLAKVIETAKLNDQNAVLKAAEDAIKKPGVLAATTGIGSIRPDFTLPTDVALGKQAIAKLFNIELKNRSGAAVTLPEFERLKDEYGKGVFKTPDQLAGAIGQARTLLTRHYQSVAAGFSPSTLQSYNENLAGLGGMPVIEPLGDQSRAPVSPATQPKVVPFSSLK